MTDEVQIPPETQSLPLKETQSQLAFPQLLIEASFESLLSHSHSSPASSKTVMPRSELSLSESWSSLSEHDLNHDDDLHSEATDTGSLIDVSNAEDIHSVDEHGESSEAEEDLNYGGEEPGFESKDYGYKRIEDNQGIQSFQSHYSGPSTIHNIRLDDSTVVVDAGGTTSLQASKSFTNAEIRTSTEKNDLDEGFDTAIGIIRMSMSSERLKSEERPYNILYHGSLFVSSEIKSEVLSKIGAALIDSANHRKSETESGAQCYHVIPSEFGPGSRPSTADLIPIPTQMHINVCSVLEDTTNNAHTSSIHLQLSDGRDVVSRQASFFERGSGQSWSPPDLVIIVTSRHDNEKDRHDAQKMVNFANRHQLALLCLRQEAGWDADDFLTDADPSMLHKLIRSMSESGEPCFERKMLVDVDSFLALDTEQLSQHLNQLKTSASGSAMSRHIFGANVIAQLQQGCRHIVAFLSHGTVTRVSNKNTEDWCSSNWIIESSIPEQQQETKAHEKHTTLSWHKRGFTNMPVVLKWLAGTYALTILIIVTFNMFQTLLLPYAPSFRTLTIQSTPPHSSSVGLPCLSSTTTATTRPTSTSTKSSQATAVRGSLQAFEQQVQNWIPLAMPKARNEARQNTHNSVVQKEEHAIAERCHNVVPAHISPSLKVDASFFKSGNPAFDVTVTRNGNKVSAKLERHVDDVAILKIKQVDRRGELTLHLHGNERQICAVIDLRDSVGDALTSWLHSSGKSGPRRVSSKRLALEYTRLLEIRTTKAGLINSALELHYSATKGIGAAVEAVERKAVKQVKDCQNGREDCFVRQLAVFKGDMIESAKHARKASEDAVENTRRQMSETITQARTGANELSEQVKEEISKALRVVQSSVNGLSVVRKSWPVKVTRKLATAQTHAQQLVKRSRSRSRSRSGHKGPRIS